MFHIGQEVICVDADGLLDKWLPLAKGATYTIRGIWPDDISGPEHVYLAEITNSISNIGREFAYEATRFRPVRKTDISIFTAMLTSHKVDA